MGNKKLNLFEKIVITTAAGMVINKATGKVLDNFLICLRATLVKYGIMIQIKKRINKDAGFLITASRKL